MRQRPYPLLLGLAALLVLLVLPACAGELAVSADSLPAASASPAPADSATPLPAETPIDQTTETSVPEPAAQTFAGNLLVEEYAIVSASVDTPTRLEYWQHVDPRILETRRPWREPWGEGYLAGYNAALGPFGLRIVARGDAEARTFAIQRAEEIIYGDLNRVWRPAVREDGGDYALLVEDSAGQLLLLRQAGAAAWDPRWLPVAPIFLGNSLVVVESDATGLHYTVRAGQDILYEFELETPAVDIPVKGLWTWDGQWVLEVDGRVLVNGRHLNRELGYDEIFGWQLIAGQPFYFFRSAGQYGVSYAGSTLPLAYDEIVHGQCCEPAAFNAQGAPAMVSLHARRGDVWHYVEMGVYE